MTHVNAILALVVGLTASTAVRAEDTARLASVETFATVDQTGRAVIAVTPSAERFGGPAPQVIGQSQKSGASSAGLCPGIAAIDAEAARELVVKGAVERGVAADFVLALVTIESGFDSTAISEKGAYGLMQLTPATAEALEVDLCKPEENVRGGMELLHRLNEKYQNPVYVLAAYNAGEPAVDEARGIPAFPETVSYIAKILNEFDGWPPAVTQVAAGPAGLEQPVETEARVKRASALPAKQGGAATKWKSGFVMSFDY